MDQPQPLSAALEHDLHNLRQLNRFFGSHDLIRFFLNRWIPGSVAISHPPLDPLALPPSSPSSPLNRRADMLNVGNSQAGQVLNVEKKGDVIRVVDLATGSGDIPRLVAAHARTVGAEVAIDAIDAQAATLEAARKLSADFPEIRYHEGDIRTWKSSEPYDIVLCSLVLHHFSEEDAVRVLAHAASLSRQHVLVADLRRGPLASFGVAALTALIYRHPMTRHDARLSAARAFSAGEFCRMARQAGWKAFRHAHFKFARQAIWLERGHIHGSPIRRALCE